jgi:hypothetical protein
MRMGAPADLIVARPIVCPATLAFGCAIARPCWSPCCRSRADRVDAGATAARPCAGRPRGHHPAGCVRRRLPACGLCGRSLRVPERIQSDGSQSAVRLKVDTTLTAPASRVARRAVHGPGRKVPLSRGLGGFLSISRPRSTCSGGSYAIHSDGEGDQGFGGRGDAASNSGRDGTFNGELVRAGVMLAGAGIHPRNQGRPNRVFRNDADRR